MTEVKAQRPSEAFSLLKASILVAIVAEIQSVETMVSADFQNLLNIISGAFTRSDRIVMKVVGCRLENPGTDIIFCDENGLVVDILDKYASGRKRKWIDASNIRGLDIKNLSKGDHLIAIRTKGVYSIIPTERLYA